MNEQIQKLINMVYELNKIRKDLVPDSYIEELKVNPVAVLRKVNENIKSVHLDWEDA